MWEEDVHVPLILHAPGFPAQRLRTVTENVDVTPTVLNLLGMTQGVDPLLDGKSLVPLMTHGDAAAASWGGGVAIVEGLTDPKQPHDRRAVLRGPMKLTVDLDTRTSQLFNLQEDPLERKDLSRDLPDVVRDLRAILDQHTALSAYILGTLK
jgi:arylsulfatase A-like enzyme